MASAQPIRLIIHEDGTLTCQGRARLQELGPSVEFVARSDADPIIRSKLAKHPRCNAIRQESPLFLKLFDIAMLAGPRLSYCDSDVLFIRRFTGLFAPPVETARFTFMADNQHAYALRPWQLPPFGPVPIIGRVNTGLIVWQQPELDLDRLEWLFGRLHADRGFCSRPYWVEQTSWAVLAARAETFLFDERRIVLAQADMSRLSPDVIAIHFVSTYRDRLVLFQDRPLPAEPPVSIPVFPGRRVSAFGMSGSELRRRTGAMFS